MNVALTRAKCLMILVCNPNTLQKDPLWYQFVKYCKDNNACAGEKFDLIKNYEEDKQEIDLVCKSLDEFHLQEESK